LITSLFPYNTRHFILSAYPVIKKSNPDLPVLIREAQGTPARAFARFGKAFLDRIRSKIGSYYVFVSLERGVEKHVELDGLSAEQVEQKVTQLLTSPPS
jgi:NADH dehydrogenase (ubiquinone) 1 alpha subcomplex subunit 2